MKRSFRAACLATGLLLAAAAATPARAATVPGWYSSTDLSFVMQRGNSETLNLGINTNLTRQWLRTAWRNNGSFVRTDVNEPTIFAVGTPSNFVFDTGPRVTKSEKLFFNSDLERRITERFFWNVAGNVERDPFAGLRHRETGALGIGYLWQKPDNTALFRMGVAGTYTNQEEVVDDPETENQFAGVRLTMDGEKRFGDRNQNAFTSNLIVDENVQDTDDLRFNWQNAIAVEMNQRLALKLGAQVAYDHQPQLIDIPLILPNGADGGQVAGRADELDLAITMSIVINIRPGQRTQ
jgi:putative salt-induced outer membrane protein YdiY